ncbi:hypothetical protein [Deinococcus altitudinis]|uniref:hypothetical protein n=1 Tax=Deinococcus altitudinis TaxID=468914 RepID=UPI003891B07F
MNLFTVLAGQSTDTFNIGGVKFMAAPVTLDEYAEFLSLPQLPAGPDGRPQGISLIVQADWMADKLRRRIQGKDPDPVTITGEWVQQNVPLPTVQILQHVLLYGEMPKVTDEKKAP